MEKPEYVSGLIHMGNDDDMMTLRESEAIYYSEIFANCCILFSNSALPQKLDLVLSGYHEK